MEDIISEVRQAAENTLNNLLPKKLREAYEKEYENFESWCKQNNVVGISENVLLAYFDKESKVKKASSLWAKCSMLKDEYAIEARKISKILNFWDFGFFVAALRRYGHENSQKRIQLVIQDYFKEKDSNVLVNTTQNDAQVIKDIFPECSLEEIIALLDEIGNEDNRIRIVVKKLLRKSNNLLLKRTYSGDLGEDNTDRKKTKIAVSIDTFSYPPDQPSTSTENVTEKIHSAGSDNTETNSLPLIETDNIKHDSSSSTVDSQSTITYSFDDNNKNVEAADIKEVTPADRDILMSIIEFNLKTEPSSSNTDEPNNDVTSTENLTTNIINLEPPILNSNNEVVSNGTSYLSKVVDDDPMLLKIIKVSSSDDIPSKVEVVGATNVIQEVPLTAVENVPSTSVSTSEPVHTEVAVASNLTVNIVEKSFQPTTFNTININVHDNVPSTSKPSVNKEDDGDYHLYNHLMEMFTNVSRKSIKYVCQSYGAYKHQKPSDKVFSAIVSDLLMLSSANKGSSSDDSDKADKVNSTIVVPNSPEEEETPRFTPPHEPARQLLDVPLNLISRTQLFPFRIPENVVHNVQEQKNTAPLVTQSVAPPKNRVNDMLNNILSDLMEAATDSEEEDILAGAIEEEPELVNPVETEDDRLIYPLMEMFPEACPQFIRKICKGKTNAPGVLDDLISQILESDYPKRKKAASPVQKMDAEEQLEMLKQILPDADPSYLQIHCDRLIDKPDDMKIFIANAIENRSYPKLKDYLRRQQISAQQKQYTTEFKIENFLELIPDPRTHFEDPKRKQSANDSESEHYAICFLRNHFSRIPLRSIRESFKSHKYNFLKTFKILEKFGPSMQIKSKRAECRMPEVIQNIPLLQEIAYLQHRSEIEEYLRLQKVKEQEERAAAAGAMQTCSCCFDDEVMPKHIYTCESGCIFCKECVQRGAEVSFGDGKLDFVCLNNCSSHFSLQTLQAVLKPKLFSKIAIKKQVEEVKAAGIEDLEMCPFCDFATIPAREDKLFRCLNPECMKESCRLCKEPSHVPLRCEEVEKEDDVKKRTYIENKMTEALLRTCYKCNKKFIKDEGCNKMTCSCGAFMCYVCGKPVTDYKHFNGAGGDRFDLCPLYSDTNKMHQDAVLKGAEEAKKEVGIDDNSMKMKIDPSSDVQQHYKEIAKKHPPPPVFPYVDPFVGAQHALNQAELMANQAQLLQQQLRLQRQRNLQQQEALRRHHHHHHH